MGCYAKVDRFRRIILRTAGRYPTLGPGTYVPYACCQSTPNGFGKIVAHSGILHALSIVRPGKYSRKAGLSTVFAIGARSGTSSVGSARQLASNCQRLDNLPIALGRSLSGGLESRGTLGLYSTPILPVLHGRERRGPPCWLHGDPAGKRSPSHRGLVQPMRPPGQSRPGPLGQDQAPPLPNMREP